MSYKIHTTSVFEKWPIEDKSIQAVITSPPYYSLRKYNIPDIIIGGEKDCEHDFNNNYIKTQTSPSEKSTTKGKMPNAQDFVSTSSFCTKCNAWKGQYGLEPDFKDYIEHTRLWIKEVHRVLRDDGVFFLNMGDSYPSGGGKAVEQSFKRQSAIDTGAYPDDNPSSKLRNAMGKCKLLIPHRIAINMIDEGWILRNDIIWCLSGGTYIYAKTQKGESPMMIRDMARLDPKTVKLWNGNKWTQVLGYSKSKRKGIELEIVLRSGERISCTPTHQFPTNKGLLRADKLCIGDILQSAILPEPDKIKNIDLVPNHIGWFIGLYIAEGSRSGNCIQISGHIKETERFNKLLSIVNSYGGAIQKYNTHGKAQNINIHSKLLNAILDEYVSGKTAIDKCLSSKCWQRDNNFIRQILDGYLSGDGHWDIKNNRWRLGFTRNYNLERDLRTVCARLGYNIILNLSHVKFKDKIFYSFRGEIRLEKSDHKNCKNKNEIIDIRKARCREVYDICVEDDPHLFALSSGILTHNSKSNAMPESVKDRFSRKYENIFLFVKKKNYYFNLDAIREPWEQESILRLFRGVNETNKYNTNEFGQSVMSMAKPRPNRTRNNENIIKDIKYNTDEFGQSLQGKITGHSGYFDKDGNFIGNINGKNPGDIWNISTQASSFKHYAMWPQKLVERMILCSTKEDDIVLDPFAGSGTTLKVAIKNNRKAIGIDLGYEDIQEENLKNIQTTLL